MKKWLVIFIFFALSSPLQASNVELDLIAGLEQLQQGDFDTAWTKLNSLAEGNEKYKLAQLLKAELLAIKSGNLDLLKTVRKQNNKTLIALLSEAKVRLRSSSLNQQEQLLEQYVLKSNQDYHLLIVNTETSRLHVYGNTENGYDELANYYITIGRKGSGKDVRGDLKTPIGVYVIKKELLDKNLAELYGVGALTLNYPNKWDQKKGRTGDGIWLHGTPRNTFSRAPLDSRGCVVLNNSAMDELVSKFNIAENTPVIIIQQQPTFSNVGVFSASRNQQVLMEVNYWLKTQTEKAIDWETVSVFSYPSEEGLYYISFKVKEQKGYKLVEKFWKAPSWLLASTDFVSP